MIRPFALTALLALSVCACGAREAQTPTRTAAAPKPQPQATTQGQGASAQQPAAQTPESETEQATAAQESAGDTAGEEDRGPNRSDITLERLAALPADAQLPGGRWKPGVNYDPLVPEQPTSVGPGKVEVVEVFWLGCPHCYALEPYLQNWLKSKPDYIEFVRVPVMWGPVHRAHARLYYTLQALGRADLFEKAFETVQQQRNPLVVMDEANKQVNDSGTLKAQEAFAADNGIKPDDFAKAYNSFSVNSNLQRAEQLTLRYHVEGVPLVVIGGKYTSDVGKAGSPGNLTSLITDLAAAERHH